MEYTDIDALIELEPTLLMSSAALFNQYGEFEIEETSPIEDSTCENLYLVPG